MHTDDKEQLNRQLTSLRVAASLIQGWVTKSDDPHPEKSYARMLAQLNAELENTQSIVQEHRENLLLSIANRHNQSDAAFKTAAVFSISDAKNRRAAKAAE